MSTISWGRVATSFLLAMALSVAALGILSLVHKPQTFAVIDARSEYMEFSVFNPELSFIYAAGLRISSWPDGSRDEKCASGTLVPDIMSRVSYQRVENQGLVILVDGKGELRLDGGTAASFDGEVVLFADASCGSLLSNRFPVWGPGKIGSAFAMRSDGPGPILLEGSLATYGRTIDLWPFGRGGAIYSATDEPLAIPSGGHIETNTKALQAEDPVADELTALFGYVTLSDEPGLAVHVTTETPRLQISTPGAQPNSSRIEVGLFAQVLNDPTILAAQILLILLVLLWPITIDLVGLAVSGRDEGAAARPDATSPVASQIPDNGTALRDCA